MLGAASSTDVAAGTRFECSADTCRLITGNPSTNVVIVSPRRPATRLPGPVVQIKPSALPRATASCREDAPSLR
jgi:hypothetical protein